MNYRLFKNKLIRNGISKGIFFFLGALSVLMLGLGFSKLSSDSNRAWMWFTFSIFSVIFTAVFAMVAYGQESGFRREDRDYTEEEFAAAAALLEEAGRKQATIFGEDFLISVTQRVVVRYRDILWAYILQPYFYGAKTGRMLEIRTRKHNIFKLAPENHDDLEELEEMMRFLCEKNPGILVGFTDENKRIYDSVN